MWTAQKGCVEVARLLLERGAATTQDEVATARAHNQDKFQHVSLYRLDLPHSIKPVKMVIWVL